MSKKYEDLKESFDKFTLIAMLLIFMVAWDTHDYDTVIFPLSLTCFNWIIVRLIIFTITNLYVKK